MKKTILITSILVIGLVTQMSAAFATACVAPTPGPLDSETGLAGVIMAGAAAFLVWRRRKA
jgi:LPXTG-motif cell wall-anchored protein